jgi:hypothetical protein
MSFDPALLKLGKRAPRVDPRTLRLAKYAKAMPPPPSAVGWPAVASESWPMDANDTLGDCTCAAVAHLIQLFTACAKGAPVVMPTDLVVQLYEKACGYNPADPSTDQGGVEIDVLNFWRNTGVQVQEGLGFPPDKITAYASVNPANQVETRQAIAAFGGLYLGLALPKSAQGQTGGVWDVVAGPDSEAGSWGGHAVPVIGYDATGLYVVTWGAGQKMTWAFWAAYVDEAYAILTPDWIESEGTSPSGLDLPTLIADLASIS